MRAIVRLLIVFLLAAPSAATVRSYASPHPHSPELAVPVATAHAAVDERPSLRMSAAPGVLTVSAHTPRHAGVALLTASFVQRHSRSQRTVRGRAPPSHLSA